MKATSPILLVSVAFLHAIFGSTLAAAQDVGQLVDDLKHRDEKVRQKAVGALADLDTEAAWEAVADRGLGDLEARVADEAQLRIGRASYSKGLGDVLESKHALKARSALVRERVSEALGRMKGALPADPFVTALKDKEAAVRAVAAYALETRLESGAGALDLADSKGVIALRKALAKVASSDRDARARANAISALAALAQVDAETEELLGKSIALTDSAAQVRAASLRAASLAQGGGSHPTTEELAIALRDEAHGVGMMALRLLRQRGDRESFLALAQALPPEGSDAEKGGLRPARAWAIVACLREASGLSHGLVRERWIRWAEGLEPDWKRSADGKEDATESGETGSATFYGLRIVSDRVAFLVDMSGSMWEEKGGSTRKVQVEVELAKALRGLPEHARFHLVPYATVPGPWEDGLVPATERNVEKAIEWFERNTQRGRGDVWTALMQVLENPEIDTVVILSDGAPSGGYRWNIELIRTLLQDENRHRGVVIHAVMFDAAKSLRKGWKAIVDDWGGVQLLID
ncbi:hypothetical protein Poly30_44010 [Planctomycetes bacterium Poly30]|uniref:VWFA domain-containing protein n=1 Tax=Saltatorellus ferox TaxID=2528018 RepID=A0A518EXM2_9BACT|nr:hypothetical protein Poly30_44010 [Planctomycetes bacterium Poly30]